LALLSLLTGRPARLDVALSGELTLSGRILPVSGILPQRNAVEVEGLEKEVKEGLEVVLVSEIDQALLDQVLLPA